MTIGAEERSGPEAGLGGAENDANGAVQARSTSEKLDEIIATAPGESITLGWLLDALNERAFGVFLLILALPCCIPFLYGVPQVVAVPLLFVSAQMVAGRASPWLPERLRARRIKVYSLAELARRARPYLTFFERLSRPRLSFLTRAPLDRLIGVFLLVFCASILTPLPSTNTVPGIAVAITALGLLERDGALVLLGGVLGSIWIGFLVFAGATIVALLTGG